MGKMKKRLKTKFVSLVLATCMSFMNIPMWATETAMAGEISTDRETTWVEETGKDTQREEDCMVFKYVDEKNFKKHNHVERLKDEESLDSYVYLNSDGTKTVYYMYENVKYIDETGETIEKDITLINGNGGYETKENNVELLIPENPSSGIDISYDGYTVTVTPQGIPKGIMAEKEDNAIVYENYFGTNASLKYTPLLSGIKEDIVLTEYTGNTAYVFTLETDGLNIYYDDKGYHLANEDGKEIPFDLGEIVVYDAVGKPGTGTMKVTVVEEGEKYLLTIEADKEFLSDPTTEYPVTKHPKVTMSQDIKRTGSIEDAPVFKGYPTSNFGAYLYNRLGTPSSAYGIGRTVVRLTGLYNSSVYKALKADQIQSVKFYVREASGTAAQAIKIHPMASNTTWTETNITWNTVGSFNGSRDYGTTIQPNTFTGIDITELVKDWKKDTYPQNAGFIMRNSNESSNKCFCSSEYSVTSYRPYVEMTYKSVISLDTNKVSMMEGASRTLTATTNLVGKTVKWTSSNTNVATVTAGKITAIKAGVVTITASVTDSDNVVNKATCTVYVYVPNGVYYISNLNSSYYLNVYNGRIENLTDVYQLSKHSDNATDTYKIRQLWKVKYLDNGRYSIRPMNKLDMGLDVTQNNVDIYSIGTSDTLSGVPSYGEWTIEWKENGYVFKNNGESAKTMQVKNASTSVGATVIASAYSSSNNCRWKLTKMTSPPSGVYWYDVVGKKMLSGNPSDSKYVIYGSTNNIDDLGLVAVYYSPSSINQNFTWSSSNADIAAVDSSTGSIVGKNSGNVQISAKRYVNGSYRTLSFDLIVIGPEQYNSGVRIATIGTKQYYDFTIPINKLFKDAIALCEEHRCMNWEQYCEWAYDLSILYQPSVSEHAGMQLGSFLWFYQHVNNGEVWDIKIEERWKAALPNVPYLKDEKGNYIKFAFRNNLITAEDAGNIMYGYTGRATGFGEITLYWGGGVAKTGSTSNDEVTTPPYYGDDENDHYSIKMGFDMFNSDFPNYPEVGFDGIPLDGLAAKIADVILSKI